MGEVIQFESDTLYYIPSSSLGGMMAGVGDSKSMVEIINHGEWVSLYADPRNELSKDSFKQLAVALHGLLCVN